MKMSIKLGLGVLGGFVFGAVGTYAYLQSKLMSGLLEAMKDKKDKTYTYPDSFNARRSEYWKDKEDSGEEF